METFKKILKIIFGNATPVQLLLACLFASMLGFTPSFSHAPFIFLLLIFLILVLRVNLGFTIIVYIIAKILSYILEPLSFHLGVCLLNGFTQPIFISLINTPILAFSGFEYYLVTGGLAVGIIFGIISGITVAWIFQSVRKTMANIQTSSDKYQQLVNKFWIKLLTWILLGKAAHKVDWIKLRDKKFRQPFRITGVIIILIIIGLGVLFQQTLQSQMVKNILQTQLEKANGATVNIQALQLNLVDAKISIKGLALANPNQLNQDRFYAKNLTMKVNIKELLTKKLVIENLVIDQATTDHARSTKASLYAPKTDSIQITPEKTSSANQKTSGNIKAFNINKYAKNAKQLKEYQMQIKRLIRLLDQHKQVSKTQENNIENQVQIYGYAEVINENLIIKTPTLTIQNLTINNLISKKLKQPLLIKAKNIATEPSLLKTPTSIQIKNKTNTIFIFLEDKHQENVENIITFKLKDLPAEPLLNQIKFNKDFKLKAKSFTASSNGTWELKNNGNIIFNLPTQITFKNLVISSHKYNNEMDELTLNVNIENNVNNPVIKLEKNQLQKIIINTGISKAKDKIQEQLKNKLPFSF